MSMNLLPDICLFHIFNSIHDVHTLFRCLRVCKRWNYLVNYRLARAERLLDKEVLVGTRLDDKSLCYDTSVKPLVEDILTKILKESPKLKVVSVGAAKCEYKDPEWLQKSINRLSELKSLEGLLLSGESGQELDSIPQSVKYLFCDSTTIKKGYYPRVKHLLMLDDIFVDSIHRFPNVEWLNLRVIANPYQWFDAACNNKHLFRNLKMLEIDTTWEDVEELADENLTIQFINICPQLESAHLRIPINQWFPDDNSRHENLTNLVITFAELEHLKGSLEYLRVMLQRFPNIKHLAIKYMYEPCDTDSDVSDDSDEESDFRNELSMLFHDVFRFQREVEDEPESNDLGNDGSKLGEEEKEEAPQSMFLRICRILPALIVNHLKKLVLLDMRKIIGVDEHCNEFVQLICKSQKRSIKFYYGNTPDSKIKRDWPELFDVERDSSTFKFMAIHFLRDYHDIRESVCPNMISDV